MNGCALDLSNPQAAYETCVAILRNTSNSLELLLYGVMAVMVAIIIGAVILFVLVRSLRWALG